MAIYRAIDESDPKDTSKPIFQSKHEEDIYYWNMKDPLTGHRYDIPMLNRMAGDYFYQYINYMKMRERSPETFETMMRWD